jgi:hypothetical protein
MRRALALLILLASSPVHAAPETPGLVGSAGQEPPAAAPLPPYSLPWQLRTAFAGNVVRSDTSFAFLEDATAAGGATIASMLLATHRVSPELAPLVRLGFVSNTPPSGAGAAAVANPIVGGTYAPRVQALGDDLRFAAFFGVALPIGMGGGNTPDAAVAAAMRSGVAARSAMDNAMFAVNYLVLVPGFDLAYLKRGFTAQLEVNLLELIRTRGAQLEKDEARTNLTAGLHAGYFVLPQLSLSGEVRYQRWLSTPAAVAADTTGTLRDNLTFAAGPRGHFKLADKTWFRPGISYGRGLDDPMSKNAYHIVQLDLPISY